MKNAGVCPECGFEAIKKINGSSVVLSCSKCDWSVATTYISPEREDVAVYRLFLYNNAQPNIEQIRVVSKITGENFIVVKSFFDNNSLIFEGNAVELLALKSRLEEQMIAFIITPEFKY